MNEEKLDNVVFEENDDSNEECTDLALGYDPERWEEYDADAAHRKDFCKGFATAGGAAALIGLVTLFVTRKLKKKKTNVVQQPAAKTPYEAAEEMRRRTAATVVESDFNDEEYDVSENTEESED